MTLHLSPAQSLDIPINEGGTRKRELMGDDHIVLKFALSEPATIGLGAWAVWGGERFYLTQPAEPKYNTNTGVYDYELQLDAQYFRWRNRVMCFAPEVGAREASWSLTDHIEAHAGMLLRNIKAGWWFTDDDGVKQPEHIDGNGESRPWTCAFDKASIAEGMKCITYNNTSILDALTAIAEAFACEWWITDNVIHFGKCEQGESVEFEIGRNLSDMTPAQSRDSHATRIYPFGSTRNIPDRYGKTCLFEVTGITAPGTEHDQTMPRGSVDYIAVSDSARPVEAQYLQGADIAGQSIHIPQADTASFDTSASHDNYIIARRHIHIGALRSGLWREHNASGGYKFTFTCGRMAGNRQPSAGKTTIRHTIFAGGMPEWSLGPSINSSKEWTFEPDIKYTNYDSSDKRKATVTLYPIDNNDPLFFFAPTYLPALINFPAAEIYEEITIEFACESCVIQTPAFDFIEQLRGITLQTSKEISAVLNLATFGIELPASEALQVGDRFTIDELIPEKAPLHYFTEDSYIRSGLSTTNSFAERRLSLPALWRDGAGFVEYGDTSAKDDKGKWNGQTPYAYTTTPADGIVEQIVTFEDIYPTLANQQVTEVWTYEVYIKDPDTNLPTTQTATRYLVRVPAFDSASKEREDEFLATGGELQLTFNSGLLCGRTFSLEARYSGTSIKGTTDGLHNGDANADRTPDYTLYELVEVDENGITTPNTALRPNTGDKVTFFGYNPAFFAEGTAAIADAERKLLAAALSYLDKAHQDPLTYTCKPFVDVAHALNDQREQYPIGQRVTLKDNFLFSGGERASRILGFELPLDLPWDNPTYTVGESSQYSRLGAMQAQIDGLKGQDTTTALMGGNGGSDSRISIDNTRLLIDGEDKAAVKNADTAKNADHAAIADDISEEAKANFLRKDADDETPHKLTANALEARTNITAQSITIGGITISVQNGALVVGGNLAATGGITALQ